MKLQLNNLYTHRENLQKKHGEQSLYAIHGAGCTKNPDICFVFMNPTGKNVSAVKGWKGIRAPWLGTKNVRKIFYEANLLDKKLFDQIQSMKAGDRTEEFAETLYLHIAKKNIYITNLAKCTQADARPLKDNTKLPFEINLIKEDGQWKIFTMNVPQGGLTDQTTDTQTIPSQTATTVMVQKAMELFANAVNKGDFTSFYSNIAKVWQDQTSANDLLKAFQVFVDNKIDFLFTSTMEPTYTTTPTIDENGILDVQGTFAAQDGTVIFEQKYFQENGEWKLFGFNVQVK